MRPNSGASRCMRENVGGAAICTSHFSSPGSAFIRTCTAKVWIPFRAITSGNENKQTMKLQGVDQLDQNSSPAAVHPHTAHQELRSSESCTK